MADDNVKILQWPPQDLQVAHSASQPVPLCFSVCEPICAESDYTIAIDIFDRPVAAITVRGLTRLFNCPEKTKVIP